MAAQMAEKRTDVVPARPRIRAFRAICAAIRGQPYPDGEQMVPGCSWQRGPIVVHCITRGNMRSGHLGNSLDDFLAEGRRLAEAETAAAKRVLAFQIASGAEQQVSKKHWGGA